MGYMTMPNPNDSRASKTAIEKQLKQSFRIKRFKSRYPILAIDFGKNHAEYCALLKGDRLDKLNCELENQFIGNCSAQRKVMAKNIAIIITENEVALTEVQFTYIINRIERYITSLDNICLLETFRSRMVPSFIKEITYSEKFLAFQLGIIDDITLKETIYSSLYSLFYIDQRLYINANVALMRYPALLVADYLTSITTFLHSVGCTPHRKVYTKIDIHSPGNILVFIEDALSICSENWVGLALAFICIFGGEAKTPIGSIKFPSIRNFIEYFANWEYERKMKEEDIKQKEAETVSKYQDNVIKDQEIRKREYDLIRQAAEIQRITQELNIATPFSPQPDPKTMLNIVNEHQNKNT